MINSAGDTAVKILLTILSADRLEEPAKIGDITGWRGCFDTIIVSCDIGGLCSSAGEPVHADAIRIHFRTAYEVIDRPNPIPNKILSHGFTDQRSLWHGIRMFFGRTSYTGLSVFRIWVLQALPLTGRIYRKDDETFFDEIEQGNLIDIPPVGLSTVAAAKKNRR